jgi:hypothetical protein
MVDALSAKAAGAISEKLNIATSRIAANRLISMSVQHAGAAVRSGFTSVRRRLQY